MLYLGRLTPPFLMQNINELLNSLYRAAYVLLVLKFAGMMYHKVFRKSDYDYVSAKLYIMAYYPENGQGLLIFKSEAVSPDMLEWFKVLRDRMQRLLPNGTVRIVTEEVPPGEIKFGTTGTEVMERMCKDGLTSREDMASLLVEMAASYQEIASRTAE